MKQRNASMLALLVWVSCSGRQPLQPSIPGETFIDFYAHVLIVREEGNILRADSAATASRVDSLYARYGLARDGVESDLRFYRSDLTRWRALYDGVIRRLENLQREGPAKPIS